MQQEDTIYLHWLIKLGCDKVMASKTIQLLNYGKHLQVHFIFVFDAWMCIQKYSFEDQNNHQSKMYNKVWESCFGTVFSLEHIPRIDFNICARKGPREARWNLSRKVKTLSDNIGAVK